MHNILVTGGAGFIGSNFINYLLNQEADLLILNLDSLTYAGNRDNLANIPSPEKHVFIEGDICTRDLIDELLRKYRIDTIVNFAGTFSLLEAVRIYWLEENNQVQTPIRFHHISTDEVFGALRPADPAFCESTPYSPNSPYAASKASADHLVSSYNHTFGLPTTITHCSNNYGPHQFPEKLMPLMILNCMQGKALPVYGDGKQIRDWLYVEDHCEAVWQVLQHGRIGETYNIGGNNQHTNIEIVLKICALMDEFFPDSEFTPHKSLIQFIADRPGHDRRYAMNIQKIYKELGWKPKHTIEEGLRKTIEWYIQNQSWVNNIRQKLDYQGWLQKNYAGRGTVEK
jgi:dTDP-glucose 4,6-dehydratase